MKRTTMLRIIGAVVAIIPAILLSAFVFALPMGWIFMLTVGVIHHDWSNNVPTLGFWWALLIIFLLRLSFASASSSKSS